MNSMDYSKDYWLWANGACAICLLTIIGMIVMALLNLDVPSGPESFLLVCFVGICSRLAGMGTARFGHSRVPFVLWLLPFAIVGGLCLAPVSH